MKATVIISQSEVQKLTISLFTQLQKYLAEEQSKNFVDCFNEIRIKAEVKKGWI